MEVTSRSVSVGSVHNRRSALTVLSGVHNMAMVPAAAVRAGEAMGRRRRETLPGLTYVASVRAQLSFSWTYIHNVYVCILGEGVCCDMESACIAKGVVHVGIIPSSLPWRRIHTAPHSRTASLDVSLAEVVYLH